MDEGLAGALSLRLRLERRWAGCAAADELGLCDEEEERGLSSGSDKMGAGAGTGRGAGAEGEEPAASSSRILRMVRTWRMRLSWIMAFQEGRSWAKSSFA